MFKLGSYKKPFFYALLVHLAVLLVLSINLSFDRQPTKVQQVASEQPEIVQAVAVDESQVQAQMDEIRAAEAQRQRQETEKQQQLEQQAAAAQSKRKAEEERLLKVQKLRQEQAKKKQEEQKQLAELEKQKQQEKVQLEKIQQQQREAEDEKRRLEEEAIRRKQLQAEQKRLAQEQAKREASQKAAQQGESLRYIALMQEKVKGNWIYPTADAKGLECVVRVRLNKDGKVLLVQVVHGSGNAPFDRSVEAAVLKSSPLPLPADPTIMEGFPELRFKFKPQ